MKKVGIATHAHLADGMKSVLEMLLGTTEGITFINAYTEDGCLEDELERFAASVEEDSQGILFTDICGGSVNQKAYQMASAERKNIMIVTGFNLAAVIEIVMAPDIMSRRELEEVVARAKEEMKVMPENVKKTADEEAFF
ncbi:MAG: hypothetical protein Q4F29_07090 [Lachnospiraceae bacterium]|nr:hypothetical protein [Lachnospiraceae bacterium]